MLTLLVFNMEKKKFWPNNFKTERTEIDSADAMAVLQTFHKMKCNSNYDSSHLYS